MRGEMTHFVVLAAIPDGKDIEDVMSPFSDSSENPKWDWYVVGGRWSGMTKFFPLVGKKKRFNFEKMRKEPDDWSAPFHAFVDLEGKWHERGEIGWFGYAGNENAEYYDGENGEFWNFIRALPDDAMLCVVDCHGA